MWWRRWTVAVVMGLTLSFVACGSSKTSAGSATTGGSTPTTSTTALSPTTSTRPAGYMTAQEIASKLAPLGCVATPSSPSARTFSLGEISPVAALDCTVSGEDVTISEYLNAQQVATNIQVARGQGCIIAKQSGVTNALLVVGTNWAVHWPKTTGTAQAIEKAIGDGAKIVSIHC